MPCAARASKCARIQDGFMSPGVACSFVAVGLCGLDYKLLSSLHLQMHRSVGRWSSRPKRVCQLLRGVGGAPGPSLVNFTSEGNLILPPITIVS